MKHQDREKRMGRNKLYLSGMEENQG